jgi:hypothetical protein
MDSRLGMDSEPEPASEDKRCQTRIAQKNFALIRGYGVPIRDYSLMGLCAGEILKIVW